LKLVEVTSSNEKDPQRLQAFESTAGLPTFERRQTDMQSISCTPSIALIAHATKPPFCNDKNTVLFDRAGLAQPVGVPALAGTRAGVAGLDPSETSVRSDSSGFFVDAREMKVKRARYATLTAARLHKLEVPTYAATFIGLTYRPGCDYEPLHITYLVKCVRAWCDARAIECRYIWVAEMQKRGVIHYHMLVFHPKRFQFPKPDKQGWWPHGSTNRSTGIKHAVAYMAKYMSKGDVAAFPKGARTYGCGGLQGTAKLELRWWKLPTWVRKQVEPEDRAKRVRGGFMFPHTGEIIASPWVVRFIGGRIFVNRRVESHGGPSERETHIPDAAN
jgi:hypothetical protein